MTLRKLLREPLLHFLLLGGALFLWYELRGGGGGPGSTRIVLGSGQIEHLVAGFHRTWQRPPTDDELKALLDDWVREEIASREAMAMGLDRDDTVIRRRLRQKLEFLLEDAASAVPPSEADLEAWLESHADAYVVPPQLALRQVFVSVERRGAPANAEAEAGRLLAELARREPGSPIDDLGDASMLPQELELTPLDLVARAYGDEFATAAAKAETGRWVGPLPSTFGLHLVFVRERRDARRPELAEVRSEVERDAVNAARKSQLAGLYDALLAKYTVVIEAAPTGPSSPADSANPANPANPAVTAAPAAGAAEK